MVPRIHSLQEGLRFHTVLQDYKTTRLHCQPTESYYRMPRGGKYREYRDSLVGGSLQRQISLTAKWSLQVVGAKYKSVKKLSFKVQSPRDIVRCCTELLHLKKTQDSSWWQYQKSLTENCFKDSDSTSWLKE